MELLLLEPLLNDSYFEFDDALDDGRAVDVVFIELGRDVCSLLLSLAFPFSFVLRGMQVLF